VEGSIDLTHFEAAAALTSGTLSNPRVDDDNDGKQVSARVGWKPMIGLMIGGSYARGEWLNGALRNGLSPVIGSRHFPQEAFGIDAEYSRDYWLVRAEVIRSRWWLPKLSSPFIDRPLEASAGFVEGRYRFTPRWFGAARLDGLTFSKIRGSNTLRFFSGAPTPWDAPVSRIEAGGGFYIQRNLIVKGVVQRNWRTAGLVHNRTFVSGQLAFWF
jgi:hypothetical protein